ncbi:MAG: type I-C CRISPR-associated protein Cas8c/Csd1 [Roseburia sp. 1XD42-69]
MVWQDLIETYDRQQDIRHICPIAHTQILAHICLLLDDNSNLLAGARVRQSVFAPCTVKSECRTRNVAPHLIHDKISYVTNINPQKHDAYMEQLSGYVADTDDYFAKIVLNYLRKETISNDLRYFIDLKSNPNLVIAFGIRGQDYIAPMETWTDYYVSKLPKNGICALTGESDFIPDAYPSNIRYSSDMAKLFCVKKDKLDGMPQIRPGYIASQKIIHTLQSFFVDWEEAEPKKEDVWIMQKA